MYMYTVQCWVADTSCGFLVSRLGLCVRPRKLSSSVEFDFIEVDNDRLPYVDEEEVGVSRGLCWASGDSAVGGNEPDEEFLWRCFFFLLTGGRGSAVVDSNVLLSKSCLSRNTPLRVSSPDGDFDSSGGFAVLVAGSLKVLPVLELSLLATFGCTML